MIRHFLWLGVLSLLLMNCSGKEDAHDHAKESVEKESVKSEHSDEIVLAPEKAEAAGVKTETVQAGTFRGVIQVSGQILQAGTFRGVIQVSGQILASQGDEATVVASTSGVVSFVRPLVEGMAVAEDKAVLTVSGSRIQDGDAINRTRVAYETAKADKSCRKRISTP